MTVTHDLDANATVSDADIGEAISIEPEDTFQEMAPPSDTESSLADITAVYLVTQIRDQEKIRNVIRTFNSDVIVSTPEIGEAINIELEDTPQEMAPPSDFDDSAPMEMATSMAQQVLNITNSQRARVGASPLRLQSQLIAAAQAHSNDMARHLFMSHTGSNGSSMADRIRRHGYRGGWLAENVAMGQSSSQDVMRAWMNSSGHRKNILRRNYRYMGIAYARGRNNRLYWTQTFGG